MLVWSPPGAYSGWARSEIFAQGRHLATYQDGATYFAHADALGTERLRTRADGSVYEACTSLPFGDQQNCSFPNGAASDSPLHFTGQPRDPETGLDDFGTRYNNSTLGRWMTPDWSAQAEPVPYAKLDNPQSLNLYTYVLNNPVTSVDPDGHCDGPDGQAGKCDEEVKAKANFRTHTIFSGEVALSSQTNVDDGIKTTAAVGNASIDVKVGKGGGEVSAGASGMKAEITSSDPAGISEGKVTIQGFSGEANGSAELSSAGANASAKAEAKVFSAKGELRVGKFHVSAQFNAIGVGGEASVGAGSSGVDLSLGLTVLLGANIDVGYGDVQGGVSSDAH